MSTYIDSLILFILCTILYPSKSLDVLHIMCILLLFSLYCFEYVSQNDKIFTMLGIFSLTLCFFIPELSVFLPMFCYLFFYRKQYLLPCLYIIPYIFYLYKSHEYSNLWILVLAGLSFYLAFQSGLHNTLTQTVRKLRDNSVEKEMILKKNNTKLLESQNDQIYIATLKERNRIAREIHDSVGHMLSRSILQVGALLAICKDETIKPHLETLKNSLNEAMNSIRDSVHDLHDESIDLKEAVTNLVNSFTFCPVWFSCEISRHIPREVKYCFLAITTEALNNTIKHSNATKISIMIKELPAFYQLLIEDNGTSSTGYLPDKNTGIGLTNMRDRVDSIHGIIHISNEKGFRIFVSVPK